MKEALKVKGYVPVLVGKGEDMERIHVSIKAIHHPTIVELLDQSAHEYGHQQGLLRIKCDTHSFKAIIDRISKKSIICDLSCVICFFSK
ncbi:Small auxin-up RNA [Sesbania bispinosa]|nr:Small auxin-up RNA [Sesbania bispinosa]